MFLFQDAWWSAKSDLPSFHDNVILTLQNESNRIRKHVFFVYPHEKNIYILEDAIVFFGRTWMKQVATLTLRP